MHISKHLIIITLSLMAALPIFGQNNQREAYTSEINKMLLTTNAKQTMIDGIALTWQQMNIPLTDPQLAAQTLCNELWPEIVDIYVDEYMNFFTIDDIRAINDFYSTPSGQKFATSTGTLTQNAIIAVNSRLGDKMTAIASRFLKR